VALGAEPMLSYRALARRVAVLAHSLRHQNASPLGVSLPLPPFGESWDALHTISFLLQNAQTNAND